MFLVSLPHVCFGLHGDQHNNVYILGVTKKNSNVTMILAFLSQLVVVSHACLLTVAAAYCPEAAEG
jgi:hypothetical protein